MRLLLLDWFLLSLLSRMGSWLSISMFLALYPLARGYLSLTIFFLLSINSYFVKVRVRVSNKFLLLLDITCTTGYYFLRLVDITCTLWMITHMIKWVRVCYHTWIPAIDQSGVCFFVISMRCMLNTWYEVKPIFVQAVNTQGIFF